MIPWPATISIRETISRALSLLVLFSPLRSHSACPRALKPARAPEKPICSVSVGRPRRRTFWTRCSVTPMRPTALSCPFLRRRHCLEDHAALNLEKCSGLTIIGRWGYGILPAMRKPTLKQILAFPCPTCGAAPGVKCELSTGLPRFEPHQARRLLARER